MFDLVQFDGLSKEEKEILIKAIESYLKEDINDNTKFIFDHRGDVLKKAREYKRAKEFDYSRVFYTLYFEHLINLIIFRFCLSRKINFKEQSEIIRSLTLKNKFSWFLKISGFPEFKHSHLITILNLASKRNSFIHYKYKSLGNLNNLTDEIEKELISKEFGEIEKAVRYAKTYNKKINIDSYNLKEKLRANSQI